jgi:hypothetical protein
LVRIEGPSTSQSRDSDVSELSKTAGDWLQLVVGIHLGKNRNIPISSWKLTTSANFASLQLNFSFCIEWHAMLYVRIDTIYATFLPKYINSEHSVLL